MPDSIPVLSDHAYVSRQFLMNNGTEVLEINVGSWNLQDKCFSKASHRGEPKYANNPYDADETPENYITRKQAQINKIKDNINPKDGDDVVLLQEIDFLLYHPDLKQSFQGMLLELGYELVLTQMVRPPLLQQPMALIYNTKKLEFQESKPLFPSHTRFGNPKYRAYESIFKDNKSGQPISFVNLHLLYEVDYKSAIDEHLNLVSKNGILSIMGGDTNSPPDSSIKSLLRDEEMATNFSHDPIKNMLTTSHELPGSHQTSVPKAYDRFFAAAPPQCYLETHITNRSEQVFIDPDGNAQFCPALLPPEPIFDQQRHCFFSRIHPTDFPDLDNFLQRIKQCSEEELDRVIARIKASTEYQKLITAQTWAAELFEKECEERISSLKNASATIK